jgi:hypothetical protein
MKSETEQISGIEERYATEMVGKLGCFDRMIIFGTLLGLRYPEAVARELTCRRLGAFDLKVFAQPLTDALKQRAEALAKEHGVRITYLADWREDKEEIAQGCLRERGERPGLVCILTAIEKCQTFAPRRSKDPRQPGWIKACPGRCLHYYFYFFDAELGLIHLRVPSWIPMRLHFCLNGHAWMQSRLREAGLDARSIDNAIVETKDWQQARALSAAPPMEWMEKRLQSYIALCCPHAERFGGYYLSLSQVELSLDLVFHSEAVARDLCAQLVRQGILALRASDLARFFGHQFSSQAEATARFNAVAEGVLCMRHWLNGQSLKLYHKANVLRLEVTTYDLTFYKHHREVVRRDGSKEWRVAPLKKSLYSLGTLFGLMEATCRRYLEWLSRLEDPRIGRHNLDEITRPKRDEAQRSWRGFNFFAAEDYHVLVTVLRGEGLLSGWTNRRLRTALGAAWGASRVSRILRRMREHGLIHRIPKTFKYYLTRIGLRAVIAAFKLREHLIVPTLDTVI